MHTGCARAPGQWFAAGLKYVNKGWCLSRWPPLSSLGWTGIALLSGPISWLILAIFIRATDVGKYLAFAYLLWIYLDGKYNIHKDRRWNWFRRLRWWNYHRDYFPIKLVKTEELPPDRNYLFAVFPHGIFTLGAVTSFATEALDFDKKFPGLKMIFCTLDIIFKLPILREFALGAGFTSVSKENINRILSDSQRGTAIAIAVGGAAEAMINKPNQYSIVLKNRKGFLKVAIRNGCDLVPVYAFGETDVFDQYIPDEGSVLRKAQVWLKKVTSVGPVLIRGAGPLGIFPKRVPINVVVGKPIEVIKSANPTSEEIDRLHARYRDELVALFDEYKGMYLKNKEAALVIC